MQCVYECLIIRLHYNFRTITHADLWATLLQMFSGMSCSNKEKIEV